MNDTIKNEFIQEAEYILSMEPVWPVGKLGGYGKDGEAIYTSHPFACPSVLLDKNNQATLTVMSNGSVEFSVANKMK